MLVNVVAGEGTSGVKGKRGKEGKKVEEGEEVGVRGAEVTWLSHPLGHQGLDTQIHF